jgi:hypothetical protein
MAAKILTFSWAFLNLQSGYFVGFIARKSSSDAEAITWFAIRIDL